MRLCIIGNSHVAALQLGASALTQDISPTFFAAPGKTFRTMQFDGQVIVPGGEALSKAFQFTSGGLDRIELANYDAFLIVGAGLGFGQASVMLDMYALSGAGRSDEPHLISPAALRCAVAEYMAAAFVVHTARFVRSVRAAPIAIAPTPLPARSAERLYPARFAHAPTRAHVYAEYCKTLDRIDAQFPVIRQPDDTIEDICFTREALSRGSFRLRPGFDQPHPDDEPFHMNAEFGRRMMADPVSCWLARI